MACFFSHPVNIITAEEKITQLIAISACECFVVAHLALSRLVADHEASMLTAFSWESGKFVVFPLFFSRNLRKSKRANFR